MFYAQKASQLIGRNAFVAAQETEVGHNDGFVQVWLVFSYLSGEIPVLLCILEVK